MSSTYKVEAEEEVVRWLNELDHDSFVLHGARLDKLEEEGEALDDAYYTIIEGKSPTMPKAGELRKLILYDEQQENLGISYFISADHRIFLLTVVRPKPTTFAVERDRAVSAWKRVAEVEGYMT